MTLVLKQYGITLKRIEKGDLELIRKWRNYPDIRKYMAYKKKISQAQQLKWFEKVDNKRNYYFLIVFQEKPVGVINCKEVNLEDQYGEGGIFIWDKECLNTPIPVFASIILIDFIFNGLSIGDKSFIRILRDNLRAIEFNKSLGYVLIPGQSGVKNQWYVLTKESFNQRMVKLKVAARNFTESDGELIVTGEVSEKNVDELNVFLKNN